ncbi:aquaporin [Leucobacter sp. CSA2]|uniref:Aquaporin n=1 Tax=Leucobacter edaphi TaxID=2796472 RepID=A0A934UYM2_9MICO|nr:aquaporin [Leucobacter edaphi]MBK0422402.1 aquaporin [Leucobacter edaphi]
MTGTVRKAVTEALATFLFVFGIIAAVNAEVNAAAAIGFMLMVLVYATGHISGGHLNPAVSLAILIRGAMSVTEFFAYVVAQCVGGVIGAVLSMAIFQRPVPGDPINIGPSFLVEAFFTFVLVFVVLNVATSKDHPNNSFYGLAIGATVFVGATTVGGISGGGFNPAVALGLAVSGQFAWSSMWLYILAPLVGAVLAALVFRFLSPNDHVKAEA